MNDVKEQRLGVSIFLMFLFLAAGFGVFWIAEDAYKSGVVYMIGGRDGITKLYRENSPETFWVGVGVYALAGLGCVLGSLFQLAHAIRKLRVPRLRSSRR
jgi:hypothetical protein